VPSLLICSAESRDGDLRSKSTTKARTEKQTTLWGDIASPADVPSTGIRTKGELSAILDETAAAQDLMLLKRKVNELKQSIKPTDENVLELTAEYPQSPLSLKIDVLTAELDQILDAQTLERAKHYLSRLRKGIDESITGKVNDINILRWKEYTDIITDSLWIIDRRDSSGAHLGWYWGNFIPQIPHQLMLRYSKRREWVLDPFVGSGTTLIECRRLGRNGVGIELNPTVAQKAEELISQERNDFGIKADVIVGDSRSVDIGEILGGRGVSKVQLIIVHPPYHDIIRFSEDERDLSNAKDVGSFLSMLGQVVANVTPFLDEGRYLALVIGDKYQNGVWIPLGFRCMDVILSQGCYSLKSIIVKNFDETRAKRSQQELWRYRALVGGFYVFKHEYIFVFQKVKD